MIVIADAGPLLHLHWVAATAWALPPLPIHVVDAVWFEVERHDAGALADPRLVRAGVPTAADRERVRSLALDDGETAAIAFALAAKDRALILCDERRARHACGTLGLEVVGSIGLILESFRAKRVERERAVTALRALPSTGRMHVTAVLIEETIRRL